MIPYWTNDRVVLWQGHVLDCLAAMEAGSVHCAISSPPYWGLRNYDLPSLEWGPVSYAPMAGLPPLDIPGCEVGCVHVWGEERIITNSAPRDHNGAYAWGNTRGKERQRSGTELKASQGQYCQLCGGWRGCLGLEPTPEMFVGHIVLVARELWRVMRDDGCFFLNFGDSYAANRGNGASGMGPKQASNKGSLLGKLSVSPGLKEKDLIGIPWRVAFALQADGWYLRSAPPWIKPNCMPESVRDRATTAHEFWFQLTKSKRYYFDAAAARVPPASYERKGGTAPYTADGMTTHGIGSDSLHQMSSNGRNRRTSDTWNESLDARIAFYHNQLAHLEHVKEHGGLLLDEADQPLGLMFSTKGYSGAHFATFNGALITPMILSSTSAKGCCPECGSPWVRVVEKASRPKVHKSAADKEKDFSGAGTHRATGQQYQNWLNEHPDVTTGWRPTCSCDAGEPVPCTVLDPFLGSGTTAEVADFLGRHSVGIELSKKYCDEHIIPRLTEPLFEWAEQEPEQEPEPEIEQLGLL